MMMITGTSICTSILIILAVILVLLQVFIIIIMCIPYTSTSMHPTVLIIIIEGLSLLLACLKLYINIKIIVSR